MAYPPNTKGTYRGYPCVVTNITSDSYPDMNLLEFPGSPDIGWTPDVSDIEMGMKRGNSYLWERLPSPDFVAGSQPEDGYHCVICNGQNKFAAANMTNDRHICFSCHASYSWKFEKEEFIPGVYSWCNPKE